MNMMTMNAGMLSQATGHDVTDVHVLVAKNDIAGLAADAIGELLGVSAGEILDLQQSEVYRDIRLILGAEHAKSLVETDFSWDSIEQFALKNLMKRIQVEKDPEFNLKVAAVANRAQRRIMGNSSKVLDPLMGAARVPLQLTSRIVKRLNKDGSQEIEETRQISVVDGSATNPSFDDIDKLLGVSPKPQPTFSKREADFSIDEILDVEVNHGRKNG